MKPSVVNYAVIGVGNMGRLHARVLHELSTQDSSVRLVGLVDTNISLATKLAQQYHTQSYPTLSALLANQSVDAVSVCVPTSMHGQIGTECLAKGIHVLMEKPIALTIPEAKSLLEVAKRQHVTLFTGHIERYNPAIMTVKSMIDAGVIGDITVIEARRVGGFPSQIHDANITVDLAIHDIDIANYLIGQNPTSVHIDTRHAHLVTRADSVVMLMEYPSGQVATIHANWITPVKRRNLVITGKNGYIEVDYIAQTILLAQSTLEKFERDYGHFSDFVLSFGNPEESVVPVEKSEPLKNELRTFLKVIAGDLMYDPQHAIDALTIALTSPGTHEVIYQ